ncbi:hypothetical protein T4B_14394, partial [Trichinella pseudospiralis]
YRFKNWQNFSKQTKKKQLYISRKQKGQIEAIILLLMCDKRQQAQRSRCKKQEKLNEKKGNDPDECRLVTSFEYHNGKSCVRCMRFRVDSLAQFWCPPGLTNPTRQLVMILDPSQSMNLDFTSPDNSSSVRWRRNPAARYRGNEGNARVHWDFPYERQFLGRPRNAGITTTDRRKNNFLPPAAVSVYAKRDEGEKATTLPVTLSKPVVEIIILAMSFDIQY